MGTRIGYGATQNNFTINGAGSVSVGSTSTNIVAQNIDRAEFTVQNDSDQVIYLGMGQPAELHKGIRLNPQGGSYSSDRFLGPVNAIVATGPANLTYIEI